MERLEPDDLYEERSGVSFARPILQGDVFEGIVLPGFDDEARRVQIVTHPCSMRRGPVLNNRIQVAPVDAHQKVSDWNGHGRVMPLPDLLDDGSHHAARFVDLTSVAAEELTLDKRIASLSQRGILVLQQRIVKHDTRLELDLGLFREQSSPVLAEAEMQETWVETVLPADIRTMDAAETTGKSFQQWLDEDDQKRRQDLQDEANHPRLRKETRAAAQEVRGNG